MDSPKPNECKHCGAKLEPRVMGLFNGTELVWPRYCCSDARCLTLDKAEADEEEYQQRRQKAIGNVPPILLTTDIKALPSEKARRLTKWVPMGSMFNADKSRSKNNLFVCGPSRTGKSRVIATAAINYAITKGQTVFWSDAWTLEEAVMGKPEALRNLASHRLLCLDDLGKERMTERMASGIFKLLDLRVTQNLTTFISSNWTPTVFAERFNDTTINDAVKGRLVEFFDRVLLDERELPLQ